jgi:hypothetical protein
MKQSGNVQRLFSRLVGLRTNLTVAEFDSLAELVLDEFPGLTRIGLNQNISYVMSYEFFWVKSKAI